MKKIIIGLLIFTLLIPNFVFAKEFNAYYTTLNGKELSERQYNNLLKAFSKDTIDTMSRSTIDLLKNDESLVTDYETKYIKTEEIRNIDGDIINSISTEISKEESDNAVLNNLVSGYSNSGSSGNDTHTTSHKILTIGITGGSASVKTVTVTNTWRVMPSTRSFDVIAIRPDNASLTVNSSSISGYQKWNDNIIDYAGSSNIKIATPGGVGISMNIVNDSLTKLENSITVVFLSGASPFKAFGSYQHATSDVTLDQSKNYSISASGMGGVINFNANVASNYDNTQGVEKVFIFGEL